MLGLFLTTTMISECFFWFWRWCGWQSVHCFTGSLW